MSRGRRRDARPFVFFIFSHHVVATHVKNTNGRGGCPTAGHAAPSMSLLNAVLAVSHGKSNADLLSSNVAGFVYVTEVDMQKKQFTYVSPSAGELPSRNLLMGSLKWIETLN